MRKLVCLLELDRANQYSALFPWISENTDSKEEEKEAEKSIVHNGDNNSNDSAHMKKDTKNNDDRKRYSSSADVTDSGRDVKDGKDKVMTIVISDTNDDEKTSNLNEEGTKEVDEVKAKKACLSEKRAAIATDTSLEGGDNNNLRRIEIIDVDSDGENLVTRADDKNSTAGWKTAQAHNEAERRDASLKREEMERLFVTSKYDEIKENFEEANKSFGKKVAALVALKEGRVLRGPASRRRAMASGKQGDDIRVAFVLLCAQTDASCEVRFHMRKSFSTDVKEDTEKAPRPRASKNVGPPATAHLGNKSSDASKPCPPRNQHDAAISTTATHVEVVWRCFFFFLQFLS